ncbi:MAG: DEAD/DEAH box helicase [Deltaproteobacteria bacterium]|nr:DEAD/DEAH box helicase [Deltaproteobacteria bacterium]
MSSQQRKARSDLPRKSTFKSVRKHEIHYREGVSFHPQLHADAQLLLSKIGIPEQTPFIPDPFQKQALENILIQDVLVSAPTGSGKTWIAIEAARHFLAQGRRVWYAAPLKALSNAKHEEFCAIFGPEKLLLHHIFSSPLNSEQMWLFIR